MFSMRMVRCSSPRPETRSMSGSSVSSTRSATLLCSSRYSRSRNCRLVTNLPSRPASGEVLTRSEEHTSELQSPCNLVCRLLLEKKKNHENDHHLSPSGLAYSRQHTVPHD